MIDPPAFWDTSALVSLCIEQKASGWAKGLAGQFEMVAWWVTRVEICSAIARLSRSGELQVAARQIAMDRAQVLAAGWREIPPSNAVREQAAMVLEAYPLRAADSLQLAAALVWCRNRPAGRTFLCADERLCQVAAQAGFMVLQP